MAEDRLEDLAKVNALVLRYFIKQFSKSKTAKDYVFSRVSENTTNDFFVGYAPGSGLIDKLNKHNISAEIAADLGLIGTNEDGTSYEVFTHRVMFPIIKAGIITGFAGRTLKDHPIKYLNSKASPIYNKKQNLFGLWNNRRQICQSKAAIVVEGYFDVLGLYEHGVRNAVASCGTAFSSWHALELKRYTKNVWICYDGDEAGEVATEKTKAVLSRHGIFGGVIKMPTGKDPDEFVAENGTERFINLEKD